MADILSLTLTGDQEAPTPVATDASGTGTVAWDGAALTAAYEVTIRGLDFGPVLGMEPQTADTADDVIVDTIPETDKLPETGGSSLLALGAGVALVAGAASLIRSRR